MQKICFLPPLTDTLNGQPYITAAGLAAPFEQVVLRYPKFTKVIYDETLADDSHNETIKRCNAVLRLLNRPTWIQLDVQWPEFNGGLPSKAYANALLATQTETQAFWAQLPVEMRRLIRGFTFDHVDYSRAFGDAAIMNTASGSLTRMNRYFANALVNSCRNYALAAMIVSNRVADVVGDVYRFSDADNPGAAKWPSILGQDSGFNDWLVARDIFYTPYNTSATNESGQYDAVPAKDDTTYLTLRKVFWQFFEALPVLRRAQSPSLSVGILQHMSLTAGDGALDPLLSAEQRQFLAGLATFLQMTDIDGYGAAALPGQAFAPSLMQVNNPAALPDRLGAARFYSVNGAVYADYLSTNRPVRVVTTPLFDTFTIQQLSESA